MLNKAILIGRLTKDPALRFLQSGVAVASFTLAVDRTFKNRDGEKDTDFIPIVTWRKTAELCEKYLSKGSMAAVIDVYKRQLNTFKTYINQERRQSEYNDTTRTKAKRLDSCICI